MFAQQRQLDAQTALLPTAATTSPNSPRQARCVRGRAGSTLTGATVKSSNIAKAAFTISLTEVQRVAALVVSGTAGGDGVCSVSTCGDEPDHHRQGRNTRQDTGSARIPQRR